MSIVLVLAAMPAAATVLFVDADATGAGNGSSWADAFTSVQPALDAAASGDRVWVAAGRYVENITLPYDVEAYGGFAGTEDPNTFDLADRDLNTHRTILDGNRSGSVVRASGSGLTRSRLDGFVITNGDTSEGGGLWLSLSTAIIENNLIIGNRASRNGGGVYLLLSTPTIVNNTIRGNDAQWGGGIYV
jgi:parallel beta-helix repeat protein